MMIDGETIITGSLNFPNAAQANNTKNVLVVKHKVLAIRFTENWNIHRKHSELYRGRAKQDMRMLDHL